MATRVWASSVDAPRCGVRIVFGGAAQRVVRGQGLLAEDVDRGTRDGAGCERGGQRGLVDDAATGDVDEEGVLLHRGQLRGTDHAPGLGGQRHVDGDRIRDGAGSRRRT